MERPLGDFAEIDGIVRTSRLTSGHVACCMCFEYMHPKEPDSLYVDADGQMWDYCLACAASPFVGGGHTCTTTWPG